MVSVPGSRYHHLVMCIAGREVSGMAEGTRTRLSEDDSGSLETVLDRVEAGRAVLFVGAGMSMDSGTPSSNDLDRELREQFAPGLTRSSNLQETCDLLQTRRGIDRLDVDAWIRSRLDGLQPSSQHLVVPKFAWPAIYTTNFDQLIEKGYGAQPKRAQFLQVVHNPNEEFDITDSSAVTLFKINGCISRLQDPDVPLVLSGADFRRTEAGRRRVLKRLSDLQRANTWVFVGYSFRDGIITNLLNDLKDTLGEHLLRWSYAVMPGVDEFERDYLRGFKVNAIRLPAAEFFERLDERRNWFSPPTRIEASTGEPLGGFAQDPEFAAVDRQFEVVGLRHFGDSSPTSFYRGNTPTWADLESSLDVRREQADELDAAVRSLLHRAQTAEAGRTSVVVVTGSAGTGKSTMLRRLAYDLYASADVTLLVAREGVQWEARHVAHVSKVLGRPVLVLIDSGEVDFQRLRSFYRALDDRDVPAVVVVGARVGSWTTAERRWGEFAADSRIEINERFTKDEVQSLLNKLAAHGFITISAVTDTAYWLRRANAAERLILVVLLELVQDGRFEEIVLSEYQGLDDRLAEEAYRSVALVHEFGVPLRRELLRRILACDWNEFVERVVRGAATKVVIEDYETDTGRAFYRTKHALIANIIRKSTVEDPVGAFKHVFANVDAAERYDVSTVHAIVKSDTLADVLPEHAERRCIFEAAVEALPRDVVVRHQMGINEMDGGHLEEARRIFETCLNLEPNNFAVMHSFGLLEWERARRVREGPLKELLYDEALKRFRHVIEIDRHSEYGYHSAAALFLHRSRDASKQAKKLLYAGSALEMVELGLSETDSQEAGRLHDIKGEILEVIGELGAARREYEENIERGTGTAFTYFLLGRLELEGGDEGAALELIERGLEKFEEDPRLHALKAQVALRSDTSRGELIRVLGPAVRLNPTRLSLAFPYAVALYKTGNTREAARQFERTRRLSEGIFGRGKVRSRIEDSSGNPIVFEGRIERTGRSNFLRAVRDDNRDAVYFNLERALGAGLKHSSCVSFEIGFSYLGPIALNLKPLGTSVAGANGQRPTGSRRTSG